MVCLVDSGDGYFLARNCCVCEIIAMAAPRISAIEFDESSLVRRSPEIEQERRVAMFDLIEDNVFKPIRAFFERQGIRARYVSKVGHAGEEIAALADAGRFDLLVMGSHGHGNLASLVMGSVAARVMARCKTPLLLVR